MAHPDFIRIRKQKGKADKHILLLYAVQLSPHISCRLFDLACYKILQVFLLMPALRTFSFCTFFYPLSL